VAAGADADAIIAQGLEAGGHVSARASLWANLPAIVEAVKPCPSLPRAVLLPAAASRLHSSSAVKGFRWGHGLWRRTRRSPLKSTRIES
jgi:hypothetical protein